MTFNASDPKSIRERERNVRVEERARVETIQLIMSQPNGRAFILWLLERGHVFETSFTSNALSTAFREGERNVALQLFNDVVIYCPDTYVSMMKERTEREAVRRMRDGRRTGGADNGTSDDTSGGTDPSDSDPGPAVAPE